MRCMAAVVVAATLGLCAPAVAAGPDPWPGQARHAASVRTRAKFRELTGQRAKHWSSSCHRTMKQRWWRCTSSLRSRDYNASIDTRVHRTTLRVRVRAWIVTT